MDKNCNGSSIFELLCVLGLLSAMTFFAASCIEAVLSRQLVRRTGRSLTSLLEHKSLEALSRNRSVYLTFGLADGQVRQTEAPPATPTAPNAQAGEVIFQLPTGLSFAGSHIPRLRNTLPHLQLSESGVASPATIRIASGKTAAECLITQALSGKKTLRCSGAM